MEQPNGAEIIRKRSAERMKKILLLHEQGYSSRQIARMLGFKSHKSVRDYLAKGRTKRK